MRVLGLILASMVAFSGVVQSTSECCLPGTSLDVHMDEDNVVTTNACVTGNDALFCIAAACFACTDSAFGNPLPSLKTFASVAMFISKNFFSFHPSFSYWHPPD